MLTRIGEDELHHAELAFRALAWLVSVHGASVARSARTALDAYPAAERRRASIDRIMRGSSSRRSSSAPRSVRSLPGESRPRR